MRQTVRIKCLLPAIIAVLLVTFAGAANAQRSPEWNRCVNVPNDHDGGIAACSSIISAGREASTALARAFHNRGLGYYYKALYDLALADFNEAVRRDAKFANPRSAIGDVLKIRGELDRSIAAYTEALRIDPRFVHAFTNRGLARIAKGDFDGALVDLDQAIRIDPKYASAYNVRGDLFRQRGDRDRCITEYTKALQLDPRVTNAFVNRAICHYGKGDYDPAIADYDQALRQNPRDTFALNNRGLAFYMKKDNRRAVSDFDETLRLDPSFTAAYTARGMAYEQDGDLDNARRSFEAALRVPEKHDTGKWAHDTARERLAVLGRGSPGGDVAKRDEPRREEPRREEPRREEPRREEPVAKLDDIGSKRVALVIGNSEYVHSTRLANPRNDASDIADTLRRLGFDVVEGRDLDRSGMDNAIRQFSRKLERVDVAAFFYAGHGLQVGGKNYLVPIDARLERPADLALDAVDINLVLSQMENESKVNLVFLDACRDNPLSRSLASKLGPSRSGSVGQGLTSIQTGVGTLIAFATQPDNVALDGDGRNSPFTMALKKHLPTPGLDIGLIMRRVRQEVKTTTRDKQVPWDNSSLTGEVVLLR